MGPAYSAQFQGLESAIKVSSNTSFFYPIKLENYTGRIKSRFSEVLRTSPNPSHKIQLILTILTVVSLFPYLFWGTRNGSCRFSVYMLFLGIPWSYPDVLYIAGKIFSREIQRSWNRGKRFSGDGVIRETSLTIMAHRGGIRSGALNRPSGTRAVTCGYFQRFQGLWKKGDQVLYWNSVLEYRVTRVMIRPSLISSISPLPQYGFRPNVISTESYVQGEPNGAGYKKFGQELAEDVGYYRGINYSGLIRDISAFSGPPLHLSSVSLQFWTISGGIWSLSEVEVWVF